MPRDIGPYLRRFLLFCQQDGKCFYCEAEMTMWTFTGDPLMATLDHLRPRSLGGRRRIQNEVCACFSCNTRRGTMPWLVFFCLVRTQQIARPSRL